MNPHYPAVSRRARHRCEYCRAPEIAFNFAFEVEHIEPSSRGGDPGDDNLALSCHSCNLFKSNRTEGLDPETGEVVRLFDPRHDAWGEHFGTDDDATIVGTTPTARATIQCLRMNSARQITARRQWRMIGFFP